jgi:hypothetical protein
VALTVTSLNGAITQAATFVTLTAYTNPATGGVNAKAMLLVDGEKMLVSDATLTPTLQVVRGWDGTNSKAHNTLAPITYGLTSDFTQPVSTDGKAGTGHYSIAVNDSNVTLPVVDTVVYLTKAGVLAITINSPNKDQINIVRFVSLTANAHTVTYTPGFYGNTTSSDVATFPSTVGACFTIIARNGLWNALSSMTTAGVTLG